MGVSDGLIGQFNERRLVRVRSRARPGNAGSAAVAVVLVPVEWKDL
jgi:hypothetical protein